jgi:hypothetical protein
MSPRSSSGDTAYVWSLSLRDLIVLVLFADLAMLAKALLRIPLHVPGHSGILWVALFVVARGLVDKKGAGLLLGVVAGVVATVLGFGDTGPLEWTKYVAAGAMLELVCLLVPGTLEGFGKAAVAGAAAHLGKLASMVLVAVALRLPLGFAVLGLGFSAATHLVFGVIGGVIGALLLRALRRVPYFAVDMPPPREPGETL